MSYLRSPPLRSEYSTSHGMPSPRTSGSRSRSPSHSHSPSPSCSSAPLPPPAHQTTPRSILDEDSDRLHDLTLDLDARVDPHPHAYTITDDSIIKLTLDDDDAHSHTRRPLRSILDEDTQYPHHAIGDLVGMGDGGSEEEGSVVGDEVHRDMDVDIDIDVDADMIDEVDSLTSRTPSPLSANAQVQVGATPSDTEGQHDCRALGDDGTHGEGVRSQLDGYYRELWEQQQIRGRNLQGYGTSQVSQNSNTHASKPRTVGERISNFAAQERHEAKSDNDMIDDEDQGEEGEGDDDNGDQAHEDMLESDVEQYSPVFTPTLQTYTRPRPRLQPPKPNQATQISLGSILRCRETNLPNPQPTPSTTSTIINANTSTNDHINAASGSGFRQAGSIMLSQASQGIHEQADLDRGDDDDDDGDEDDDGAGAELLRLMAQHKKRTEGGSQVQVPQRLQAQARASPTPGHSVHSARLIQEKEDSHKAINFLSGLCVDFIRQLETSQKAISARRRVQQRAQDNARKRKHRVDHLGLVGKKRKRSQVEDEGDGVVEDQRQNHLRKMGGAGRGDEVDGAGAGAGDADEDNDEEEDEELATGMIGITLSLKNRKTGGNHVASFPEDPSSYSFDQQHSSGGMIRIGGADLKEPARILCVASLMFEAAVTGITTTKRDIFYKDVRLFGHQRVVDEIVDDIVATAGLKRRNFNVCATSKGLIASSCLEIKLKSGETLQCSGTTAGLIPPVERIESIECAQAPAPEWVLIVEKDAVFQTLCGMHLLDDTRVPNGVIITGKGYPDLATLQLLALIAECYPSTKFYGLFDADPHGIDILSVYAHGSRSRRHSHDNLELPLRDRLQWMGVKASDWTKIGVKHDDLLPLSDKDVSKAMSMLRDASMPTEWRRELSHMLHLTRKAEIQIILGANGNSTGVGHDRPAFSHTTLHDPDALVAEDGGRYTGLELEVDADVAESGPGLLIDYIVERITGESLRGLF